MILGILKAMVIYFIQFYCVSLLALYLFQSNFIYYPIPEIPNDYKSENFFIEGETINVIKLNENKKNAIIYFGGNTEAVVYNAKSFKENFSEHTVYIVNYRGYGPSSGDPSEKSFYSDALYLYDVLKKRHEKLSVMGRSLGSGIATYLASKREIYKMILVTPYDSIEHMAQDRFYLYPISLLIKDKYDSISNIKHISSKTLVLLAQLDKVIPLKYSLNLINEFPKDQIVVKTILDIDHIYISDHLEYQSILSAFMLE